MAAGHPRCRAVFLQTKQRNAELGREIISIVGSAIVDR